MGSGFCCDQYLPKHWMSRPMTAWFGVMIALRWLIQGFCTSAGLLAAGDSSRGDKRDLHFAGSCLSWLLCGSCNRLQRMSWKLMSLRALWRKISWAVDSLFF
jgi:hypothetical protein